MKALCPSVDTGLSGKRVLVTGASGGIGAACARTFSAEGSRVALHYHRGRERAEAVAADCGEAVLVQADLRREDDAARLFDETRASLGGVDVCVAVAGIWPEEESAPDRALYRRSIVRSSRCPGKRGIDHRHLASRGDKVSSARHAGPSVDPPLGRHQEELCASE